MYSAGRPLPHSRYPPAFCPFPVVTSVIHVSPQSYFSIPRASNQQEPVDMYTSRHLPQSELRPLRIRKRPTLCPLGHLLVVCKSPFETTEHNYRKWSSSQSLPFTRPPLRRPSPFTRLAPLCFLTSKWGRWPLASFARMLRSWKSSYTSTSTLSPRFLYPTFYSLGHLLVVEMLWRLHP